MLRIEEPQNNNQIAFSALGFRPFFFAAGMSSIALMLLWFLMYSLNWPLLKQSIAPQIWHAHEMVFAYTMAVIVGFLLTAVKNWTQVQTLNGKPLLLLFAIWLSARFLPFFDVDLWLQAIIDCSFLVFASIAISWPIIKAKSWSNIGIASKVFIMAIAHIVFYLGLLGYIEEGVRWGLYGAFYMIIALIFVMARRVVPFFIEKSLQLSTPLTNYAWLDKASLLLFLLYLVQEVFWPSDFIYLTALCLLMLHSIRLFHWHHTGIWSHPLLWSLYLAYFALSLGFALKIFSYFGFVSTFLSVHSFALGIGLITLGMMSRVILGHTGRNINHYPKALIVALVLMAMAFVSRVLLPIFLPSFYLVLISISQFLWASAFIIFIVAYTPMLFQKRIDGRLG